jgi:hypothetical protein
MTARILVVCLSLLLNTAFFKVNPQPPSDKLLTPVESAQAERVRAMIQSYHSRGMESERAKIEYLITRLKQSPYTFIRNGDSHSGSIAAAHMTWKYRRKVDLIKTARDFIEKIATRSKKTGEPYYVKLSSEEVYEASDLLANELSYLENCLSLPAAP